MKYPLIAKRFREILDERNMKQVDLSRLAGIDKSFINHYVHGTHCPSNVTAQALAETLNVNPLWLMGLSDDKYQRIAITDLNDEERELLDLYKNANPTVQRLALYTLKFQQLYSERPDSPDSKE